MPERTIRVGTAGWAIPGLFRDRFPEEGTGLERYAAHFDAAEINSTFHRQHRPATFERWAAQVPDGFRFAVKLPKAITHQRRLADSAELLQSFVQELGALGDKLGPLLVQLPPSLGFDPVVAGTFFTSLRLLTEGSVACEPRHASWFEPEADRLLSEHRVARVAADPARVAAAAEPGGWPGLVYYRLHGSPRMYYSDYGPEALREVQDQIAAATAPETWCIFDNTTLGAATGNALTLREHLRLGGGDAPS